jgi:hypothetical protein
MIPADYLLNYSNSSWQFLKNEHQRQKKIPEKPTGNGKHIQRLKNRYPYLNPF